MRKYSFRFENLEVWKRAIEIGMELFDIADDLEKKRLYRFAEQLKIILYQRKDLIKLSYTPSACGGVVNLLKEFYGEIIIPPAVYRKT